MDCIDQTRALVNTIIKLRVPLSGTKFLSRLANGGF
jgi:hypothetical protein